MNKNYPLIYYPKRIEEIIKNPLSQPKSILKPKISYPSKKKLDFETFIGLIASFIISILFIIGGFKNDLIFLSIIGFIPFFLFINEIYLLSNSEKIYDKKKSKYDLLMEPYFKKEIEIKLFLLNNLKKEWVSEEKYKKILNILIDNSKPTINVENNTKGFSEEYFFTILKSNFNNKIIRNKTFHIFKNNKYYIPDIIYADFENNIFIDIEIDESYSYKEKKPIHYIIDNKHIDEDRNIFFTNNGWFVIRFTEHQVLYSSDDCVKTIDLLIESLNNNYLLNESKLIENNITLQSCWTFEESIKQIENSTRNKL